MRQSPILVLLLACACSGEAAFSAPSGDEAQDLGDDGAHLSVPDPNEPPPVALSFDGDLPVIRGIAARAETAPRDAAIFIGLDWVIEETLYPLNRTSGRGEVGGSPSEFSLRPGAPPAAALVANEATNRPGVGVAYISAFVDADGDGILGCPESACADYRLGGSPNTMVVYAEQAWPADGAALFDFDGAAGVRPPAGWSLVHLTHRGPLARPLARDWTDADTPEVVIVGDYRELDRDVVRSTQLDVD